MISTFLFQIIFITAIVAVTQVFGYHDPDLNYHLSQVQKISNCDDGYSYPAPALQLSTSGIKVPTSQAVYTQQIAAPQVGYAVPSSAYSAGVVYQAVAPKLTYPRPAATYLPQISNYIAGTKDIHGYATSAGLSATASTPRPITPHITYAQAPIIAKVTGSPLIAQFSQSPVKTTFVAQQSSLSSGSSARASLTSYSNVQAGGPVVSQVYAAPTVRYTTSPALRVQAQPVQYSIATPGVQYSQAANLNQVSQYSTSSISQVSSPSATTYFSPNLQYAAPNAYTTGIQYAQTAGPAYVAPAVAKYTAPTPAEYLASTASQQAAAAVSQYSAPAAAVTQYTAPAVAQYAAPAVQHYAAPALAQQYATSAVYSAPQYSTAVTQHSAGSVSQYAPAIVSQYASPVVNHVSKVASAPVAVKNVHTDFLENYVSFHCF